MAVTPLASPGAAPRRLPAFITARPLFNLELNQRNLFATLILIRAPAERCRPKEAEALPRTRGRTEKNASAAPHVPDREKIVRGAARTSFALESHTCADRDPHHQDDGEQSQGGDLQMGGHIGGDERAVHDGLRSDQTRTCRFEFVPGIQIRSIRGSPEPLRQDR